MLERGTSMGKTVAYAGSSRAFPITRRKCIFFYLFIFGHTAWHVGSQFPDQGLNPGHGSESLESGTSLVVRWLRLQSPNAGGPGSIPGLGTRSHMPQLRVCMPQRRSSTWQRRSCVPQLRPGAAK